MKQIDEQWMREAITQAYRGWGLTHPNPSVGAVMIHSGEICAKGFTQPPGGNHAEIEALRNFRENGYEVDSSTTLVVTMEPCCTQGRTGPCTSAILESGIRRVVVGTIDPNKKHQGRGIEVLRSQGVEVVEGVLKEQCDDINLIFNHWISRETSFFAGKIATTLDGYVASRSGESKWITGEIARLDVARWRRYFPAIAVGAGTVLADNPSLTSRIPEQPEKCPVRIIFDRQGLLLESRGLKVFCDDYASSTVYVTSARNLPKVPVRWTERGVRSWIWPDSGWKSIRECCLAEGIGGIYFEGGPRLLGDLIRNRELDYLFAYRAPILLADSSGIAPFAMDAPRRLDRALRLERTIQQTLGSDQLIRGHLIYAAE